MPPLDIVARKIPHHAEHSGYDVLARYLGALPAWRMSVMPRRVGTPLTRKALSPVARLNPAPWYESESVLTELRVVADMRRRGRVVHFLYGEDDFFFSGLSPTTRIVATFHQPPARSRDYGPRGRPLRHLDAAVIVASNQREHLASLVGADRVHLVPLGVDTSFFAPAQEIERQRSCLFVGQWLRDPTVLRGVAERLGMLRPAIRVRALTSERIRAEVGEAPNLTYLERLSDHELREEYRSAGLLLMPLQDCTANCAVLEALACGTPVVASDVGGVRDYVQEDCGYLTPRGDAIAMSEAALAILEDSRLEQRFSEGARRRAEDLDWRKLVPQLERIYSN